MGSKNRITKYIVPIIQNIIKTEGITTYVEPFCGGCNVIDKVQCNTKIANDKQLYLIEFLRNVNKVKSLPDTITKEHYSSVRSSYYEENNMYEKDRGKEP